MSDSLSTDQLPTLSDDEDLLDKFGFPQSVEKKGFLSKWTNYLQGWQPRYIIIIEGTLSYFKSEEDTKYGCRGSISLQKCVVLVHEYDELRFDVKLGSYAFYFRAQTVEETLKWVEIIEQCRHSTESGYGSESSSMRRHGSIMSIASQLSVNSLSSRKSISSLMDRFQEVETARDVAVKQIDNIQKYLRVLLEEADFKFRKSNCKLQTSETVTSLENIQTEQPLPSDISDNSLPQPINSFTINCPMEDTSILSQIPTVQSFPALLEISSGDDHIRENHKCHRRTESDSFTVRQQSSLKYITSSNSQILPRSHSGTVSLNMRHEDKSMSILKQLKEECVTFKATTAAMLSNLYVCIESVRKKEDNIRYLLEQETEKRKQAEATAEAVLMTLTAHSPLAPNPDESSDSDCDTASNRHGKWHLPTNEEEFYDALETNTAIAAQAFCENFMENIIIQSSCNNNDVMQNEDIIPFDTYMATHRFSSNVREKVIQYSNYAFENVEENNLWSLVHEDGVMKVYRRELEEKGIVIDPLKATHLVNGITAKEMASIFFYKDTRMSWENTIENMSTIEDLDPTTTIYRHLHKRIWPSTQRETIFCSHMCKLTKVEEANDKIGNSYFVINFSVDHEDSPHTSKYIRVRINISLTCQTFVNSSLNQVPTSNLARGDIYCKMIYTADVHPGGWVPPAVVRNIGKREITKFLKKIGDFCYRCAQNKPLDL